jgi:hypothetical protein
MERTNVIMTVQPMQVQKITIVEPEESKQKHFIEIRWSLDGRLASWYLN